MNQFLFITLLIAMFATLGALGVGLFAFAKGGETNKKFGNKMMRIRVYLQGIALALFALLIINQQTGG